MFGGPHQFIGAKLGNILEAIEMFLVHGATSPRVAQIRYVAYPLLA
jgi:hypothetical protein